MLKLFLFISILLMGTHPAQAQENITLPQWSKLPILHEGRVKPLDSFARIHLKKISGKDTINGISANQWLADVIFTPEDAALIPVFKFHGLQNILNLSDKQKHSYTDVIQALDTQKELIDSLLKSDFKKWTPQQQELITLYQNASLYSQLLRSLTGLLPLNLKDTDNQNYLDLKIIEKQNLKILNVIEHGGKNNDYLRIISQQENNKFLSPWHVLQQHKITKQNASSLKKWADLSLAYRDQNQTKWDNIVHSLSTQSNTVRLTAEYFYNNLHLLMIAGGLFLFSFALVILEKLNVQKFSKLISTTFIIAIIANGLDIALRIYILNRPPVGTLYESIIFVSLICGLGFLWMHRKQKNKTNILLGSLTCLLLLVVAHSFTGDDTMDTLVAVLNTNFWLLTHVICITIGYATCFIAAMMAHYFLIINSYRSLTKEQTSELIQSTKTVVILSLLFTTIGTILGGIWADQSWGRFWGWDPKENGALLIVLWLIWLLHGRISKHITNIRFMVGTAFLSVIVVLAWFGVNLLSVGLHSYGFISGVALGIGIFCTIETLLIGALWFKNSKQVTQS